MWGRGLAADVRQVRFTHKSKQSLFAVMFVSKVTSSGSTKKKKQQRYYNENNTFLYVYSTCYVRFSRNIIGLNWKWHNIITSRMIHLSSRVQLAGSLKSAGSEVLVEPLVISTLLNRLCFRCLIMYMKKLRASDWLKTSVSHATRVQSCSTSANYKWLKWCTHAFKISSVLKERSDYWDATSFTV